MKIGISIIKMDVFFLLLVLIGINEMIFRSMGSRHAFFDKKLMYKLFAYHLFFLVVYYVYSLFNPSDSLQYFTVAKVASENSIALFQPGTKFISWAIQPFVGFGISYLGAMLLFAWFGYIGFVFAYLYFRDSIPLKVLVFKKYDLLTLILFFPNMHFWTVSLGKGSLIFMGLMMFTYAIKFPLKRIVVLVIGGFFVYMVRPHVMLFALVGVMIGLLLGKSKISMGIKILVLAASIGFLNLASKSILAVANLENSENVVVDFEQFSQERTADLSTSNSGVSMNNYPLPLKLFTFWFRPLFVDSPSFLGIFSSAENLIYLLLFYKICNKRFLKFIVKSPYMVKMSAIIFLLSSFALTFVMSNLGIMMRQKSMVMYFGFFVIYYFLADEKWQLTQKNKSQFISSQT